MYERKDGGFELDNGEYMTSDNKMLEYLKKFSENLGCKVDTVKEKCKSGKFKIMQIKFQRKLIDVDFHQNTIFSSHHR